MNGGGVWGWGKGLMWGADLPAAVTLCWPVRGDVGGGGVTVLGRGEHHAHSRKLIPAPQCCNVALVSNASTSPADCSACFPLLTLAHNADGFVPI